MHESGVGCVEHEAVCVGATGGLEWHVPSVGIGDHCALARIPVSQIATNAHTRKRYVNAGMLPGGVTQSRNGSACVAMRIVTTKTAGRGTCLMMHGERTLHVMETWRVTLVP